VALLPPDFTAEMDARVGCLAQLCLELRHSQKMKKRCWWTHPDISNRLSTGQFHITFGTHRKFPDKVFLYYKMSTTSFDELLNLIYDKTMTTDTNMRKAIHHVERLAVT
jgi:hypothetical protein